MVGNLYVYGGAYLFGVVGIAEGLLSSDVQGLARYIHESMLPFVIAGWILLAVDAQKSAKLEDTRLQAQGEERSWLSCNSLWGAS